MSRPLPDAASAGDGEGPNPPRSRSRKLADTSLAIFCAGTLLFLVYRDLALPRVAGVEVWFGIEVHGAWARWSAPLHWAIFAAAALAFWRAWPPIWRLAIGYSVYIAASHLIWNLTSESGGGLASGLAQGLLFLIPTAILARMRPASAGREPGSRRTQTSPSQAR